MSEYPKTLFARSVNPGTEDEYMLTGTEPGDVDASRVGGEDSVDPKVARYALVGSGSIHYTAPVYVEDQAT